MLYFLIAILGIVGISNLAVFFTMSLKNMHHDFWELQSWIGRLAANLFYAPAWLLKGLMYSFILATYWILFGIRYFITVLYRIFKILYNKVLEYIL